MLWLLSRDIKIKDGEKVFEFGNDMFSIISFRLFLYGVVGFKFTNWEVMSGKVRERGNG